MHGAVAQPPMLEEPSKVCSPPAHEIGGRRPPETNGRDLDERDLYDGCRRMRMLSRSRRLTIPTSAFPSTTGRWRNPLPSMISAARSESTLGSAVSGSGVIHWDTGERAKSPPDAADRNTSRSV